MTRHIVTLTALETDQIISGSQQFLFKFFKKRPAFLSQVGLGDLVFFRAKAKETSFARKEDTAAVKPGEIQFRKSKGEVLGQFEIGKIIITEGVKSEDWEVLKTFFKKPVYDLTKEKFEELVTLNNTMIVIQIRKLEQFITPPIEIEKRSKKEWIVLD